MIAGAHRPGAESIAVSTAPPDAAADPVLEQSARGVLDISQVRRALRRAAARCRASRRRGSLSAAAISATSSAGAAGRARRRRIAERRSRCVPAARAREPAMTRAARARAAQTRDAGERDRARGAVAGPSRPHLCHRAAHRGRQAAGHRHHARRALADPPDRADRRTSPARPSSRRRRARRPIRASASTSRRRSNRSSRALMNPARHHVPAAAAPIAAVLGYWRWSPCC